MRRDRISKRFGCRGYLHLCIYINAYHIGMMMDQLKDDWESEDDVMVFSPGDDAMGFLLR